MEKKTERVNQKKKEKKELEEYFYLQEKKTIKRKTADIIN